MHGQKNIKKACKLNAGDKKLVQNFGAEMDMSTYTTSSRPKVHTGCSKSRLAEKIIVTPFSYQL